MFTMVPRKVSTQNFSESSTLNPINIPTDNPVAEINLNLNGTITCTNANTNDVESNLVPAMMQLLGLISIIGSPLDGSRGVRVNNVPASMLWLLDRFLAKAVPNDSGPNAALTAQVYAINSDLTLRFYDPLWPQDQWANGFFRGSRYTNPQLQINTGVLAGANGGVNDQTAFVGDPTYTYALQVAASVNQVLGLKMGPKDKCLDLAIEYLPQLGITSDLTRANSITMSDRMLQGYLFLLNSAVASGLETGVNNLGVNGGGFIETRFGNTPQNFYYPNQIRAIDKKTFLTGAEVLPDGVYIQDDLGHDLRGWRNKTLQNTAGIYYLDTNLGALPATYDSQNVRVLHQSWNLSRAQETSQSRPKAFTAK